MNLDKEFKNYNNIIKCKEKFIGYKNIKKIVFKNKKKIKENLPIETGLGSCYLIKCNNIIEIYSYIDIAYSKYIQINKNISSWISKINIINLEKGDPENINYIFNDFKICFKPSIIEYAIIDLINNGFDLYIKN